MDDERLEPDEAEEDAEGQALTWKVRKPIPEANEDDDVQGQAMRPPPDVAAQGLPASDEEDVEGHGGMRGNARPPVD